jgi:hypothetical protein
MPWQQGDRQQTAAGDFFIHGDSLCRTEQLHASRVSQASLPS